MIPRTSTPLPEHSILQAQPEPSTSRHHTKKQLGISYKILNAVGNILVSIDNPAAGVQDISITLQIASPDKPGGSKATAKNCGRASGRLPVLIHLHCATLFGACINSGKLPHVASDAEKSNSRSSLSDGESSDIDIDQGSESSASGKTIVIHPFPFTECWGKLLPPKPPQKNEWNTRKLLPVALAPKLFIRLVKSGEYSGISLEIHDKPAIYEALRTYVDGRLKQKYRQDNNWSTGQKDQAAATARRVTQLAKLLLFCSLNTNVHSVEEKTCWILGKNMDLQSLH
ncbi:hypothetical protein H4Q26_012667 [Puccinia striiformis f. sp. tritici PST-130]|nr:hypothetical protein H4Q26_012667 [Puccinia striiformis f. sp. tritici PST-130]